MCAAFPSIRRLDSLSGGSYGLSLGSSPGLEACQADSADRRVCVSVVLSNRATPQLLAALFSGLNIVFPSAGVQYTKPQRSEVLNADRHAGRPVSEPHPRVLVGHDAWTTNPTPPKIPRAHACDSRRDRTIDHSRSHCMVGGTNSRSEAAPATYPPPPPP